MKTQKPKVAAPAGPTADEIWADYQAEDKRAQLAWSHYLKTEKSEPAFQKILSYESKLRNLLESARRAKRAFRKENWTHKRIEFFAKAEELRQQHDAAWKRESEQAERDKDRYLEQRLKESE